MASVISVVEHCAAGKNQDMKSCVIILNWNGWRDTIECLESVFRLRGPDFRVVVCDNGSSDESLQKIRQWADGQVMADSQNPRVSHLSSPPCPKPVPHRELSREEAERSTPGRDGARLILIRNGANLGFAGGTNVGLRFALQDNACQYFWVLNNDTVVDPGALDALTRQTERQPELGLCGSLILSYADPKLLQVQGGRRFSKWTGRAHIPPRLTLEESRSRRADFDYVEGASMLATRSFLEGIGLLEERYFLYYEEVDWAVRAKGKFAMGYAPDSIVYHKEGASIGSNLDRGKRSLLSTRYLVRSRVLFTRKFGPHFLPTVLGAISLAALHRLLFGDGSRARLIVSSMLEGLTMRVAKETIESERPSPRM
jgi:GT2 family glycosyltransferase